MMMVDSCNREKNKTETYPAKYPSRFRLNGGGEGGCRFIVAAELETGQRRYCGEAVVPGSAYCRHHRALCSVHPETEAGRDAIGRLERELGHASAPPADLAFLATVDLPELDSADEPRDLAGCVDLPAHDGEGAE